MSRDILPIEDRDFMDSDEVRGVRLQLDYLRTQTTLHSYGIEETIVVFGSARTTQSDYYYKEALALGEIIGLSGDGVDDCKVTLMTGGGPGIMEAANRGAYNVGAKSIGLNIKLPHEQFSNPYITPELNFTFQYFNIRKLHFILRARAFVIFPGGFGTLDELFEILVLVQNSKKEAIPIVLVGREFWQKLINFDFLVEEKVISKENLNLFIFTQTAKETWEAIEQWYNYDYIN